LLVRDIRIELDDESIVRDETVRATSKLAPHPIDHQSILRARLFPRVSGEPPPMPDASS